MSCAGWLPLHKRGDCCMHSIGYALDGAGLLKGMVGLRVSLAECFFLYFLLFWQENLGNGIQSLPIYEMQDG